jgi:recombinational DNA repair ATPase RecF
MDNLNTHAPSSLYKAFAPHEANRIWKRLEVHYAPKHGSWLDIAEIELNVLTRQCLNRRIATLAELQSEMEAWEKERNELKSKVDWQFRTADARTKLVSLYPALDK